MSASVIQPGVSYDVGNHKALDSELALFSGDGPISIDEDELSVAAIISRQTEDREKDLLRSKGVDLSQYKSNPVVFWEHGLKGITFPIANSIYPDGELAIKVMDQEIEAVAFFSKTLPVARQIFDLIGERLVNTTSVGWDPKEKSAYPRTPGLVRGKRPGLNVSDWYLLEWSFTGVPVHPEALVKALDRPSIAGNKWDTGLKSALSTYLPPPKRNQAPGWEPKNTMEIKSMTMPNDNTPKAVGFDSKQYSKDAAEAWLDSRGLKSNACSVKEGLWFFPQIDNLPGNLEPHEWQGEPGVKGFLSGNASPTFKKKSAGEEGGTATAELTDEEDGLSDEVDEILGDIGEIESDGKEPAGKRVLEGAHANLGDVSAKIKEAAKLSENPKVKEALDKTIESLDEMSNTITGVYDSEYQGGTIAGGGESGEGEEDDKKKGGKKSLLGQFFAPLSSPGRNGAKGTVAWLKRVAKTKSLSREVRIEAANHAKSLAATLVSSEEMAQQHQELEGKMSEIAASQKSMQKIIEELQPKK